MPRSNGWKSRWLLRRGTPAALAPFKAAYDARRGEVTVARTQLEERGDTLAEAQRHIAEIAEKIETVESGRRRVDQELRDAEAAAAAASGSAAQAQASELRKLAVAALERGVVPDDMPEGARALRATRSENEAAEKLIAHGAALDAHDPETFERGVVVAAALLNALVVAALAALALL